MQKLRSIQVLRGVAATAVVVHHAYRFVDPNSPARIGSAGVDLFFVISGFIMATIGPGRRPSEFIFDRIWRIFPMWFIAVTPWLIVNPHRAFGRLLTTLTLWPIWGGTYYPPVLLLGWTLCFEMLFYAAFTLALTTKPIVPLGLFIFCFAIGPQTVPLWYFGSPLILEFLMGALIAQLPKHRIGALLVPLALGWFALASPGYYEELGGYGALLRVLAWGIPAAVLVYGALCAENRFRSPVFDIPVLIGNASFSIYLFHRLIVMGHRPWPLELILAIVVGVAVYWTIERRIINARPRRRVILDQAIAPANPGY